MVWPAAESARAKYPARERKTAASFFTVRLPPTVQLKRLNKGVYERIGGKGESLGRVEQVCLHLYLLSSYPTGHQFVQHVVEDSSHFPARVVRKWRWRQCERQHQQR